MFSLAKSILLAENSTDGEETHTSSLFLGNEMKEEVTVVEKKDTVIVGNSLEYSRIDKIEKKEPVTLVSSIHEVQSLPKHPFISHVILMFITILLTSIVKDWTFRSKSHIEALQDQVETLQFENERLRQKTDQMFDIFVNQTRELKTMEKLVSSLASNNETESNKYKWSLFKNCWINLGFEYFYEDFNLTDSIFTFDKVSFQWEPCAHEFGNTVYDSYNYTYHALHDTLNDAVPLLESVFTDLSNSFAFWSK